MYCFYLILMEVYILYITIKYQKVIYMYHYVLNKLFIYILL